MGEETEARYLHETHAISYGDHAIPLANHMRGMFALEVGSDVILKKQVAFDGVHYSLRRRICVRRMIQITLLEFIQLLKVAGLAAKDT